MFRLVLSRSVLWPAALLAAAFIAFPAQSQARLDNFDQRVLAAHNAERAGLRVPPLSWSPALAADAARWAQYLSSLPFLEHDDSLDIQGENLWRGSRNAYTPEDMVQLWIDEKAAFHNGVFPDVSTSGQWEDVGHYTQVVWRTTALVGCALTVAGGEDEVLVCRYMEGGNILDEKTY